MRRGLHHSVRGGGGVRNLLNRARRLGAVRGGGLGGAFGVRRGSAGRRGRGRPGFGFVGPALVSFRGELRRGFGLLGVADYFWVVGEVGFSAAHNLCGSRGFEVHDVRQAGVAQQADKVAPLHEVEVGRDVRGVRVSVHAQGEHHLGVWFQVCVWNRGRRGHRDFKRRRRRRHHGAAPTHRRVRRSRGRVCDGERLGVAQQVVVLRVPGGELPPGKVRGEARGAVEEELPVRGAFWVPPRHVSVEGGTPAAKAVGELHGAHVPPADVLVERSAPREHVVHVRDLPGFPRRYVLVEIRRHGAAATKHVAKVRDRADVPVVHHALGANPPGFVARVHRGGDVDFRGEGSFRTEGGAFVGVRNHVGDDHVVDGDVGVRGLHGNRDDLLENRLGVRRERPEVVPGEDNRLLHVLRAL